MPTFALLTRLSPDAIVSPTALNEFEQRAVQRICQELPEVVWLQNYVPLGPYEYLDMFAAPDFRAALKVSALIRTYGRVQSRIWGAAEGDKVTNIIHSLSLL